jgi:hypothetical protein
MLRHPVRTSACVLLYALACGRDAPPAGRSTTSADSAAASVRARPAIPPASQPAQRSPGAGDSLARAFRSAHERRDVPALLALFEADCATAEMRALTERGLRSHLDDPIQAIRIEPPMPNRIASYEREGRRYELNLPLEGELVVVYDSISGRRSSYPVGSSGGVARLATMCAR